MDVTPFDVVERAAEAFAKSGMFGMKTREQALALMLVAQAEGQHFATAAQDYDIIQGRPARKTNSVLARFQAAGGKVQWEELTDKVARGVFSHPAGGTLKLEWTMERASKIKSWDKDKNKFVPLTDKLIWENYPRAMLRARCIAEAIRAIYPAAIGGMLVTEEAQDMDELDAGSGSTNTITMPAAKAPAVTHDPAPTVPQATSAQQPAAVVAGEACVDAVPQAPAAGHPDKSESPAVDGASPAPGAIPPPPQGAHPASDRAATPGQVSMIRKRMERKGLGQEFLDRLNIAALSGLPSSRVNEVLDAISRAPEMAGA